MSVCGNKTLFRVCSRTRFILHLIGKGLSIFVSLFFPVVCLLTTSRERSLLVSLQEDRVRYILIYGI
jgi:hypothetical protein